ncbi:unnamed protein product, partial [marine sediment metagenome]
MIYQEENDRLLYSFLDRTFLKTWGNQEEGFENFRTLELFLNTKCDLRCTYCYLANFGNELYPPELQDDKAVLTNLQILLDWLLNRKLAPKLELFAGEPFAQKVGLQALSMILD